MTLPYIQQLYATIEMSAAFDVKCWLPYEGTECVKYVSLTDLCIIAGTSYERGWAVGVVKQVSSPVSWRGRWSCHRHPIEN